MTFLLQFSTHNNGTNRDYSRCNGEIYMETRTAVLVLVYHSLRGNQPLPVFLCEPVTMGVFHLNHLYPISSLQSTVVASDNLGEDH